MNYKIGEFIIFNTPTGFPLEGLIEGRDWWGDAILNYRVRTATGQRYTVNAKTMESGHSY